MQKALIAGAAVSLALAVALGAIGAHAVDADVPGRQLWQTASFWHVSHSLGLSAVAALWPQLLPSVAKPAVSAIVMGALAFCGTLYVQALVGSPLVPFAAPTGGLLLILGWALIAVSALVKRSPD